MTHDDTSTFAFLRLIIALPIGQHCEMFIEHWWNNGGTIVDIVPLKVFFGSSTESIGFMELVASWIEPLEGVEVVLWNTPEAFPAGELTLDRLTQLTKTVNAAVFIFGEDDTVWYRDGQERQPRDNVLLEYGLFASRLGVRNSLICRVSKSKLAGDLLGLTTVNFRQGQMLNGKSRVLHWANSVIKNSGDLKGFSARLPDDCEVVSRHLLPAELQTRLQTFPKWQVVTRPDSASLSIHQLLKREYLFGDFRDVIRFMETAAPDIETLNHHPQWQNIWKTLIVTTTTWNVGHKITDLDFRLAAILDKLYTETNAPKSRATATVKNANRRRKSPKQGE